MLEALLRLFPRPRPVMAGGVRWHVLPLRIKDIVSLTYALWEAEGWETMDGHREALHAARAACNGDYLAETAEGRAYGGMLREAMEAFEVDEDYGISDLFNELFQTAGGLIFFLKILIGRTCPEFDDRMAVDLIPRLTSWDVQALIGAALGVHPLDEINVLMDPAATSGGKAAQWGEVVVDVIERTGWTLEQVGELTLPQIRIIRAGGKFEPGNITAENERCRDRIGDRRWKLFSGNGNGRS